MTSLLFRQVQEAWCGARGLLRLVSTLGYVLYVALLMHLGFSRLAPEEQRRLVRFWSAGVIRRLGLRLVVRGPLRPGAKLVVGNHVSWLDILALNAMDPCCFVSKAEVAQWPVVGRMVTLAGTIYLERARRRDALRVLGLLTQALRQGQQAAIFPEGTTGDGHALLPFHANLLQSAIDADVPVQPVAVRYGDSRSAISSAAAYVGETSMAASLWQVACAQRLTVTVTVLPPVRVTHTDRRALAARLRTDIEQALSAMEAEIA